ncbi:MAG: UDP-GlcNAc:undecaprenyl-phosphate/decaprenyl-phosphate GlcNAc-phosphate transferase [Actinomycetota bacterium]|nr:UDP-GlcNAc:undecaprenyl-phosphate/decaprenyl-phosphate GlcNAc-phosphate transferase [Actinomycetota bacterium]
MNLGALDPTLRYTLAFLVPLLAALVFTPLAGKLAGRLGVIDRPGGHKTHLHATPYLGGIAVAAGMLAIALVVGGASGKLLAVLASAAVLALVGLLDDVRGLNPLLRLGYEMTAALGLWSMGIRAGVAGQAWVDLPLTIVWVVAVMNAFNFVDNMDGVAATVAAASALGIAALTGSNGDYLVASLALAVAGATLGFLRFNFPPARIFLGDAGSMFLGFLVAALVLQLDLPVGLSLPRTLAAVLVAGVPLFDLSLVVMARMREHRPLWQGGSDHSAHRLQRRGFGKPRVVLVAGGGQLACSVIAFVVYKRSFPVVVTVAAVMAIGWVALLWWFLHHPTVLEEIAE